MSDEAAARTGGAEDPAADAPFEELQRELDAIVDRLEHGDVALDEAIALWQRGEILYRACATRLDAAELRIEELGRPDEARDTGPATL
jgi:exodeoxyribonuclease VII small subunit